MSSMARGAVWSIRLSLVGLGLFAIWLGLGLERSPLVFGVDHAPPLGTIAAVLEFGVTVAAMVAYGFKGWRSSWAGNVWALGLILGNAAAVSWFVWIVANVPSF